MTTYVLFSSKPIKFKGTLQKVRNRQLDLSSHFGNEIRLLQEFSLKINNCNGFRVNSP